DEPLSNLDARLRIQTREEIRRIQQATGITTVFVTHDQEEAMSITDEIIVMKDGVVQQIAPPQETYVHPANVFVAKFLGNPPINMCRAKVSGGQLILNGQAAIAAQLPDGEYQVGIRPESFILSREGWPAKVVYKATIGRDAQIRFDINGCLSEALIESDQIVEEGQEVHFALRPSGVHIFTLEGERIERW
ncbi:MAG: ABC transporter ATP-binding protein, partial [Spirochaetes bacterium]|nr:ABC transporter ATP-binding protein [Candidatus Aphodenecus pullistercoris]